MVIEMLWSTGGLSHLFSKVDTCNSRSDTAAGPGIRARCNASLLFSSACFNYQINKIIISVRNTYCLYLHKSLYLI